MTLEFTLNHAAPPEAATDCIVVGAFADSASGATAAAVREELLVTYPTRTDRAARLMPSTAYWMGFAPR